MFKWLIPAALRLISTGRQSSPSTTAPILRSGSSTRFIGRPRSDWSPVKVALKEAGGGAEQQPRAGARIAAIDAAFGRTPRAPVTVQWPRRPASPRPQAPAPPRRWSTSWPSSSPSIWVSPRPAAENQRAMRNRLCRRARRCARQRRAPGGVKQIGGSDLAHAASDAACVPSMIRRAISAATSSACAWLSRGSQWVR